MPHARGWYDPRCHHDPRGHDGRYTELHPALEYYPVTGLNGRMLYLFKLPGGSLRNESEAEAIAAKARANLKGGDYAPEIIIMEGEPMEDPKLFGAYQCVSYIRSILPTLAHDIWHSAILD